MRKDRSSTQLHDQEKLSRKSSLRHPAVSSDGTLSRRQSFRNSGQEPKSATHRAGASNAVYDGHSSRGKASLQLNLGSDDAALKRSFSQRVDPTFVKPLEAREAFLDEKLHADLEQTDSANLRRLSSLKPGRRRLTVEEREERRRVRNRENSRRIRERQRQEQRAMQKMCDVNEARIKELEKFVDELSSELQRTSAISDPIGTVEASQSTRENRNHFRVPEDRPGWFGDSF